MIEDGARYGGRDEALKGEGEEQKEEAAVQADGGNEREMVRCLSSEWRKVFRVEKQ